MSISNETFAIFSNLKYISWYICSRSDDNVKISLQSAKGKKYLNPTQTKGIHVPLSHDCKETDLSALIVSVETETSASVIVAKKEKEVMATNGDKVGAMLIIGLDSGDNFEYKTATIFIAGWNSIS